MSWVELQWVLPNDKLPLISTALFELNTLGIQEDYLPGEEPPPPQPWDASLEVIEPEQRLLRAWWPERTLALEQQIIAVGARFTLLNQPTWHVQEQADWGESWKEHFSRFQVGEHLVISPSWEAHEGDLVIDPGIAFGTGDHPTTRACLKAVVEWAETGDTCLDVGCGTGILGLAAAKLGMRSVGVDIDSDAIVEAQENARINCLSAEFSTKPIQELEGQYSLVVANLYAEVLSMLAPDIIRLSSKRIALAGILADRAHLVKNAFSELHIIREVQEGDWLHLWYEKT